MGFFVDIIVAPHAAARNNTGRSRVRAPYSGAVAPRWHVTCTRMCAPFKLYPLHLLPGVPTRHGSQDRGRPPPSATSPVSRSRPGRAAQLRAPFLKYHRQGARGVASRATFLPRRSRLVVGCPCPSSFLVLAEQGSGVWTDHGVVSCPVGGGPQEAAVTCVHRSVMCPQGATTGSSSSCAFRFERIVNGLM